jgi:hypothetical protein
MNYGAPTYDHIKKIIKKLKKSKSLSLVPLTGESL